jgi:hypothetical protein
MAFTMILVAQSAAQKVLNKQFTKAGFTNKDFFHGILTSRGNKNLEAAILASLFSQTNKSIAKCSTTNNDTINIIAQNT